LKKTNFAAEKQSYALLSWFLVFVQLICLGFIFSSAPWRPIRVELQIWELSGAVIALSGVIGLNWHSFSIFPEPKNKGRLITTGIFAYVRHPIYAGILIVCSALVWQFWTLSRVVALLILLIVFISKILKEEIFLSKKFPEYIEYKKNTNRLIPFLW